MTTKNNRLQPDPPEGDRQTIDRELERQGDKGEEEAKPTEQGVDLDPKRRID